MDSIHGYELTAEWVESANGSYAFGRKGHREYFVKKLPQPKYPNPRMLTPETFERKKEACLQWEEHRKRLISALQKAASACDYIIAPVEYFREDNSYYIVSSKVSEKKLTAEQVSKLDKDVKLEIMRKYAEALKALADNDVVHGDIKHSNVFIVETPKGPQPRFIDFDDSYFSGEPPDPESTIGSPEFYSPELGKYIASDNPDLKGTVTCKSDVFASAIMFHDYYSGKRVLLRRGRYPFQIDSPKDVLMAIPGGDIKRLIEGMLEIDAGKRMSAADVLAGMERLCPKAEKKALETKRAPVTGERMIPGSPKWTYVMADGTSRMLPAAVAKGMAEEKGIPIVDDEASEKKSTAEEVVKKDDKYVWVKKSDGTVSKILGKIYDAIRGGGHERGPYVRHPVPGALRGRSPCGERQVLHCVRRPRRGGRSGVQG
ncbi:MAG: hypothetical protein IKR86_03710 [Candidatus Methanomethylophilaceae archaeon]|nr:hypothetical protein [Candidatus Methanomethylophilaceae archaeon]